MNAVGVAEEGIGGAFGVGHHADDVSRFVADASDIVEGAVGIGASVAK